jgi:hypothetical protein
MEFNFFFVIIVEKYLFIYLFSLFVNLDEGVYCDSYGKRTKDILLQWGELPTSVGEFNNSIEFLLIIFVVKAYISNGKVMGWGNKAIEIRNVDSATLDGVFMHKRAQKLK